jgi:hypothetical protein
MPDSLGRVSVKRCRELVDNHQQYSDQELLSVRDKLYKLAEVVVAKFEELRTFITRAVTLDAKARIINNSK